MKLNNKGFAISTLLYGLLALLVLVLMLTFKLMRTSSNNNKDMSSLIASNMLACRDERINLLNCAGDSCNNEKNMYSWCLKDTNDTCGKKYYTCRNVNKNSAYVCKNLLISESCIVP